MHPSLVRTHRNLHLRIVDDKEGSTKMGARGFLWKGHLGFTDVQFSLASFELGECGSDRWAGWKVGRYVGNRDSGWKCELAVLGAACLLAGRHTLLAGMTLSIVKADGPKKKKRNRTYRPVLEGTDQTDYVSFSGRGQAWGSRGRDRFPAGQLLC